MVETIPSPITGDPRRFVVISKKDPVSGKVTVTPEGRRRKAAATKRIAAEEIGVKPKEIIGFNVQGKPIVKAGVDTTGAKLLKPLPSGAKASEIIQRARAISKLKTLREPVSELEAQGFVSSFQGPKTAKVERGLFGRIDPLAGTEVTITPIRKGTPKITDNIFSKAKEFPKTAKVERGLFGRIDPLAGTEVTITPIRKGTPKITDNIFSKAKEFSGVVFPTTKVKPGEFDFELARSAGELEDLFKLGATKLESQLPERKIVKGELGLSTFFREGKRAAPPTLKFIGTLIGESGRRPEILIAAAAGGVVLGAAGAGLAAVGTKSAVAVKLAGAGFGGAFLGSSVAEIQAAPGGEKFNIAARKVLATAGFVGGAKVGTRAIKSTITSIALKKAFVSGEGARTAELIELGKGSVLARRQRGLVQIGKKKFPFQLTGKEATIAKTGGVAKPKGVIKIAKGTKISEFDLRFKGAKSKVTIVKPKGKGVSFFEQKITIGKKTFIKSGLLTERTALGKTLSEPKITTNLFKTRVRPIKFRSTLALKGGGVVGQGGRGFVTTRTDLATGAIARTGVGVSTSGLRTIKDIRGVFKLGKKGAVGFTQRFKPLTIFKTTTGKPAGITGVTEISAKVATAQLFSTGLKPVTASSTLSGLGLTSFSTRSKSLVGKKISIDNIISSKSVSKSKLTLNNILKAKTTPILRSFSIPTIATITTPTTTQITTPTTTQITTPTTTQITTPSIIQITTPTITNITTPTITAPPPPPTPTTPPGLLGFKPRPVKRKERKKKKVKRKFRKTPSVEAQIFGIKGKFPKILTGLELRPLKL